MNRGLYTAATGMAASQVWLDTVANNLANANTTAFKRDEVGFEESFLRELRAANGAIIGDIQSGPKISQIATNFEMGSLQATGNALDVAISSPSGMFAVQTPTGVRYTRAGALSLNDQFELVDQNGYRVLNDQFAPIEVKGKGRILISQDGNVRAGDALAGKIAVFEGQFQKIGANLYDALGNTNANPDLKLAPETLESSNVNVVATMIEMVQVQRLYEMAQKSVQTHDETTGNLISTIRQ